MLGHFRVTTKLSVPVLLDLDALLIISVSNLSTGLFYDRHIWLFKTVFRAYTQLQW